MGKTWVLHTETKGTGAHVVPLESLTRRASSPEPLYVPRKPLRREQPDVAQPRAPHRFRVVDIMTQELLLDGGSTRQALDALKDVRSIVDVNIYVWQDEQERWRMLTFPERRTLWELKSA
jgi:hypothetical protein